MGTQRPTQRVGLVASFLVAVSLAGCVGDPGQREGCLNECDTSSGAAGGAPSVPSDRGVVPKEPDLPEAVSRAAQFEGCYGASADPYVPRSGAEEIVPEAFEVGGISPALALTRLRAFYCPRIVVGDSVFEDAAYLEIALSVTPKNDSWRDDVENHHYLVELVVAPEGLAAELSDRGLPVRLATLERTSEPLGSSVVLHRFSFINSSARYTFDFPTQGSSSTPMDGPEVLWAGTDYALVRIEAQRHMLYDDWSFGGTAQAEGDGAGPSLLGPAVAARGTPFAEFGSSWTLAESLYSYEISEVEE